MATFLYLIGRMLQILGMLYLAYALYLGITLERGGMAAEYKWLLIGAVVFIVGRFMERQWGRK
ncbi:MAG: hypothetical protein ACE5JS_02840 [Nitrospinota bacterium]